MTTHQRNLLCLIRVAVEDAEIRDWANDTIIEDDQIIASDDIFSRSLTIAEGCRLRFLRAKEKATSSIAMHCDAVYCSDLQKKYHRAQCVSTALFHMIYAVDNVVAQYDALTECISWLT